MSKSFHVPNQFKKPIYFGADDLDCFLAFHFSTKVGPERLLLFIV